MTDHPAADERAIRDLLTSYALALDTDDIARCLDLFTCRRWRFRRWRCRFITGGGLGDRPEGPSS